MDSSSSSIKVEEQKEEIIEKWEKDLTPPEFSNFEEFNQFKIKNAQFNRCYGSNKDEAIFFHCRECCKIPNSVFCVHCFNRSHHSGHHISVISPENSFCDCGDSKFISKEAWCSFHKNSQSDLDFKDDEELDFIKNKIIKIFEYASTNVDNQIFSSAIQLLLKITQWGSNYIDLISEILFDKNWNHSFYGKIVRNYSKLLSSNIDLFQSLLVRMVGSQVFKEGFISCLIETLKILGLVYYDEKFHEKLFGIAIFTFQCLSYSDIIIQFDERESFFSKLLNFIGDVYTLPPFLLDGHFCIPLSYKETYHRIVLYAVSSIVSNPLACKYISKKTECTKALIRLLNINSQNLTITRIKGEKFPTSTIIHINQYKNFCYIHNIYFFFSHCFPFITSKFDEDINLQEAPNLSIGEITESDVIALNNFFKICLDDLDYFLEDIKLNSSSFGKSSYFIQPYNDSFEIDHPLADLVMSCSTNFAIYNSVNLYTIFDRIGFKKFDQIASIFAAIEAGRCQIMHSLFLKNQDSILDLASNLELFGNFPLSSIQSLMSLKYQQDENSTGDIVIIIAESFGLPIWENEKDPTDCQRWTNVMTSMVRFFINISCNDSHFHFLISREQTMRMIADYIYCGVTKFADINNRIKNFIPDLEFINEEFEKVANIRVENNGSRVKLKPEYDDTSSVFSPYLNYDEFNKMISFEMKNHKGRLFRLNRIDHPEVLHGVKNYLHTDEMREVIKRLLTGILTCTDKYSVSLSISVFSLVRLILLEAENEKKELIEEKLIQDKIISSLINLIKLLDNGILYLQNFITELHENNYGRIAELIEGEIKGILEKQKKKPKSKIDKSMILKQFSDKQKSFESINKKELDTIENYSSVSFKCAFCDEPMNDDKPFGILANAFKTTLLNKLEATIANDEFERYPPSCQIRTCGHWAHQSCFEENDNIEVEFFIDDKGKQCPLDRIYSNSLIPTFNSNEKDPSQEWETSFQRLNSQILHFGDSSAQQCLAYNIGLVEILSRKNPKYIEDKRNVLGLIHLFKACFFMEPLITLVEPADPFVEFTFNFCSGGRLNDLKKKFEEMLPVFWHELCVCASVVEDKEKQVLMIEAYVRRISFLEHLSLLNGFQSITLPTVDEFVTSHELTTIECEMKSIKSVPENVFHLSPCIQYHFPNLKDVFTDYIIDSSTIIENMHSNYEFCQCLLCGKLCCINRFINTEESKQPCTEFLSDHCMDCTGNLCSPILFLTGELASSVCIFDSGNLFICDSIYTDKYGDDNIGLNNGNILLLNKYRVIKLFEDLITGELRRKIENQ